MLSASPVPGTLWTLQQRARLQCPQPEQGLALSSGCQMPGPVPALSAHYLVACTRTRTCLSDWRPASGGAGPRPARHTREPASSPHSPFLPAPPEASSFTQTSPTPRVRRRPPELERTPTPHPCQFPIKPQDRPV